MYLLNSHRFLSLKEDLVSCWEFDETSDSTAYDSHGDNDGTIHDAIINQSGKIDKCYDYNGSSCYVDYGAVATGGSISNLSIGTWVNPSVVSSMIVFSKWDNTNATRCFFIQLNQYDAALRFRAVLSDDGSFDAGHKKDYQDNSREYGTSAWHHLAMTFDGSTNTMKMYWNGSDITDDVTKTTDAAISSVHLNDSINCITGAYYQSASLTQFFNGQIDQTAISRKTWTDAEILAINNSNNGLAYTYW